MHHVKSRFPVRFLALALAALLWAPARAEVKLPPVISSHMPRRRLCPTVCCRSNVVGVIVVVAITKLRQFIFCRGTGPQTQGLFSALCAAVSLVRLLFPGAPGPLRFAPALFGAKKTRSPTVRCERYSGMQPCSALPPRAVGPANRERLYHALGSCQIGALSVVVDSARFACYIGSTGMHTHEKGAPCPLVRHPERGLL